jgi:DNA polymerase III alpha subunit
MKYDEYGQAHCTTEELCNLIYQNPKLDVEHFLVDDPDLYNLSVDLLYADLPKLKRYSVDQTYQSVEQFDQQHQSTWHMPVEYLELDIAQHLLDLCKTDAELQRVGAELLLFQERDLFNLLRYLKYFVDTMRKNNVVWGLGRGSSTASYVLYLLGVHKINSLYYDLPIEEFLK